jgi:hypothetical protein
MTNKELVEKAKKAMPHLIAVNPTWYEMDAYNCLRLFCERIEQTKELKQIIEILQVCANKNLMRGEELDQVSWRDREGVLITNRQALDIAKYAPLYID